MAWQKSLLNRWLRFSEKRTLSAVKTPAALRRSFALKARCFFHPPLHTEKRWMQLGTTKAMKVSGPWSKSRRVILYFHGGGYVFGSPHTHSAMVAQLAQRVGVEAVLPIYPLAPEAPFPASIVAARQAYDELLVQGYDRGEIILGGDSAGGGLALALLAQVLRDGGEVPAGLFAFSPLTDMTFSSASFAANAQADVVLPARRASEMSQMYLGDHDRLDPTVSPLYADFDGACPVWVTVGETEILLDDTRRLVPKLQRQGVDAEMHIERDLPHVWPLFHNFVPEARATLDQLALWIKDRPGWSDGN